jgi:signal transduction histidine kinase
MPDRIFDGPGAQTVRSSRGEGDEQGAERSELALVHTIVHELRQPLTVIRGQLQLGRRRIGRDPERERAAIDLSLVQVDRMSALISELLDLSALVADGLPFAVAPFDLIAAVSEAVTRHEYEEPRRIVFEQPRAPVEAAGDPARVAQILDNLLSNALKYSEPPAPIVVSIVAGGGSALVRVEDQGPGVAETDRDRLFTPFYRAESARLIPGSGLGLHISRGLAERQGARLWLAESSPAGSAFLLELPLSLATRAQDAGLSVLRATPA